MLESWRLLILCLKKVTSKKGNKRLAASSLKLTEKQVLKKRGKEEVRVLPFNLQQPTVSFVTCAQMSLSSRLIVHRR